MNTFGGLADHMLNTHLQRFNHYLTSSQRTFTSKKILDLCEKVCDQRHFDLSATKLIRNSA